MTTKRYTESDIEKLFSTSKVFSFEASDRFGESGITGMSVVKTEGESATIDSFFLVLSNFRQKHRGRVS